MATTAPYISGMAGQGRGLGDPSDSIPVIINGSNPANPINVVFGGGTYDFGETSTSPRSASVLGNSTGELAYGSGASSSQTLRFVLVNEQITSLLSKFPTNFGPQAGATSFAVTLSTEDKANVASTNAKLDTIVTNTGAINGKLFNSQQTASNSVSVVLASDVLPKSPRFQTTKAPTYLNYSSTNIGAAYVAVVSGSYPEQHRLSIFDSSGVAMVLAVGAAASEVDQLIVPPGGGDFDLVIPANSRITLKTADGSVVNSGILIINMFANV